LRYLILTLLKNAENKDGSSHSRFLVKKTGQTPEFFEKRTLPPSFKITCNSQWTVDSPVIGYVPASDRTRENIPHDAPRKTIFRTESMTGYNYNTRAKIRKKPKKSGHDVCRLAHKSASSLCSNLCTASSYPPCS